MKNNRKANAAKNRIHIGADVISINIVAYLFIGIFAIICLLPFYLIILASFTPETSLIKTDIQLFLRGYSAWKAMACV